MKSSVDVGTRFKSLEKTSYTPWPIKESGWETLEVDDVDAIG